MLEVKASAVKKTAAAPRVMLMTRSFVSGDMLPLMTCASRAAQPLLIVPRASHPMPGRTSWSEKLAV
ncbi:hypothetical protein SNL152K_2504 [Streptomyces sp. NL15-2K]|nr:hypothetical protein SNL152K_2504 [Streptomyces sp. NL15-2K]